MATSLDEFKIKLPEAWKSEIWTTLEEFKNNSIVENVNDSSTINADIFNKKLEEIKILFNSNSLLKTYYWVASWINFSKLSNENRKEISILFDNLLSSNKLSYRLKLVWKLQDIISKYRVWSNIVSRETRDNILSSRIEKLIEEAKDIKDKFIWSLNEQVEKQWNWKISLDLWDSIVDFSSKEDALKYIKKLEKEIDSNDNSFLWSLFVGSLDLISQPLQWPLEYFDTFKSHKIVPFYNSKGLLEDWEAIWNDAIMLLLSVMALNYWETIYRRYAVDVFAKMGKNEHPFFREKIKDKNWNYKKETYKTRNKKWEEIEKTRYETRKKRLIIPDYSIQWSYFDDDANLRNKYRLRVSILDQLQEQLELQTWKDKEIFRQRLEKVKSLLNVNTKSFELEAFALKKWLWNPRKLYWALRNGVIPFWQDLAQKAWTKFNLKESWVLDKYNEWYKLIFEDWKVELVDDKMKISVDSDKWYKTTYKAIIEYIDNLPLWKKEKKERIDRINNFVDSLKNIPKTDDYIKNKLYNIAVKWELNKSEVLSEIDKKLKQYVPEDNKLETKDWKEWFFDLPKEAKEEIFDKLSKVHGNNWPAILTKWHAWLIKLRYFVDKWFINLNETELNTLINEIEKWNIEFNRLYEWMKWKFKFIWDLSWKLFLKILKWDPIEFTEMKKSFDKIDEADWEKFIKEWESILKSKGEVSSIIRSWAWKNLFSLINLDKSRFNENFEPIFEEIYNSIKEKIDSWNSNYTKEKLELDLVKIYKGYLPNFVILDIFDWRNNYKIDSVDLSWLDLEKKEVKEFLEKVEKWKWHWTIEELRISIAKLIRWIDVDWKDFNENVSEVIKDINTQWAELEKASFRNSAFGIPFKDWKIEKVSFENTEYRLAELLHKLHWDNLNDSGFNKLFEYLLDKNWDYTWKDFFTRLTHSLSLPTDLISITENTSRNNLLNNLWERIDLLLNARINNLKTKTSIEQERIIKELYRLLWISETSKESELIKVLKQEKVWWNIWLILDEINTYERWKEKSKILENEEQIKQERIEKTKKALNSYINNLENKNLSLEWLSNIYNNFSSIVDNPRDLLRWDSNYEDLIKEFEDKYEKKFNELNNTKKSKKKKVKKSKNDKTKYNPLDSLFKSPEKVRKQELIKLATQKDSSEFGKILEETMERLELKALLDPKFKIPEDGIDAIIEYETNFEKYNEWLLKDFANKINVEWINYEAVELALKNSSEKWEMTEKINKTWKTEFIDLWKEFKDSKFAKEFKKIK